jgi:hypothetical protein
VTPVIFWGSSERQFESLPIEVQDAFAWAIEQILLDPSALPSAKSELILETEPLIGSLQLRRIKVKRDSKDPGFRGIYFVDARRVVFLRFVFRDRATYKRLRVLAHRARSELGLE